MGKTQVWALLAILLVAVVGSLWGGLRLFRLLESEAWLRCIKDIDQASARNLVCRSQYPGAYQRFADEYKGPQ